MDLPEAWTKTEWKGGKNTSHIVAEASLVRADLPSPDKPRYFRVVDKQPSTFYITARPASRSVRFKPWLEALPGPGGGIPSVLS